MLRILFATGCGEKDFFWEEPVYLVADDSVLGYHFSQPVA